MRLPSYRCVATAMLLCIQVDQGYKYEYIYLHIVSENIEQA